MKNFILFIFFLILSIKSIYADAQNNLLEARGNQGFCDNLTEIQILPTLNSNDQFEIGIGIYPISIKNISSENNIAEIDLYLTIEYDIEEDIPNIKCVGQDADKVWDFFFNPDIEIMSISNPEYLQDFHWMIENKKFAYMTRLTGTVELNGNFIYFPFDELLVKIIVAPEDNSNAVILKSSSWYHENLDQLLEEFSDLKIPGWTLNEAYFEYYEPTYSEKIEGYWDELSLNLLIKRNPLTSFLRTSVPLLILFLISYFSYLICEDKGLPKGNDSFTETRVSIQVGTLLALFAYSLYIMGVIPETSYLTLGDINWIIFMISTLLILFSEYLPNEIVVNNNRIYLKLISLIISGLLVTILMGFQILLLITW